MYPALNDDPNIRAVYLSRELNTSREAYDKLKREKLKMEAELQNSIIEIGRERDAAQHRVQELLGQRNEIDRRERDIHEREARINELRDLVESMLKKKVCSHVALICFSF